MANLKITTFNLNGIRAAAKRGFETWLAAETPDILLAQEVRADPSITAGFFNDEWDLRVLPCDVKGRAGVLVAVRKSAAQVTEVREGLDRNTENPEDTGRWLEVTVQTPAGPARAVSAYFHSGEVDSPKQVAKMRHLDMIAKRMGELLADPVPTVVGGDFNVVRSAKDIKNWGPNHNKRAGVLDEEIEFLDSWVQSGWTDVARELAADAQGPYTWWSWRGKAFDNDAGWRIDYQFLANPLGDGLGEAGRPDGADRQGDVGNQGEQNLLLTPQNFQVGRAASYDERISDHAPLSVTYQFG